MRAWLVASFFALQFFVMYSYLGVLPVLESEPMLVQVADTGRRDQKVLHELEPEKLEEVDPAEDTDNTIELMLAKIKRTGDAVKFQIEEQAKRRQCKFEGFGLSILRYLNVI